MSTSLALATPSDARHNLTPKGFPTMVIQSLPRLTPFAFQWLTRFALLASGAMLLISHPASAQNQPVLINQLVPVDGESGDIVYADRVRVAGASTVDLYNRAHRFLAQTWQPGSLLPTTHPSKNHLMQCGILRLKQTTADHSAGHEYRVTIEIRVKAGRYFYRLSQFRAHPYGPGPGVAIRDLYPCDTKTYSYTTAQAQPLRIWHRSVQAYIARLQRHMAGQEGAADAG